MDETVSNVGGLMGWMQAERRVLARIVPGERDSAVVTAVFRVCDCCQSRGLPCHGKICQGASSSALHEMYDGGI